MPEYYNNLQRFPQSGIEIDEIVGRASSGTSALSIARIKCESNWSEAAQTPEFDEYSFVLSGVLCVRSEGKVFRIAEGEALLTRKGERVQYFTDPTSGADYLSICLPAFEIGQTNREE